MPSSTFDERVRQYYLVLQYVDKVGFVPLLLTYDITLRRLACALLARAVWVPIYLDDAENMFKNMEFLKNQSKLLLDERDDKNDSSG